MSGPVFISFVFDVMFIHESICCLHTVLPVDILELWKQGAFIHHIPPPKHRRVAEEEDLEAVRERERGREEQEEGEFKEVRDFNKGTLRLQVNVSS